MKIRIIIITMAVFVTLSTAIGGYIYYASLKNTAIEETMNKAQVLVERIASNIDRDLAEYTKSVSALSQLEKLRAALVWRNSNTLAKADEELDHFRDAIGVNVCYLLDGSGNTIASSNRNMQDSFVGKNYAFRPYFQNAIKGKADIYMALGATSKERGIYFSHPVYEAGQESPVGVVVIKAFIDSISRQISHPYEGILMVTDPNGIIFVSNQSKWLYNTLWKIPERAAAEIVKTRQFGDSPLVWTGLSKDDNIRASDMSGKKYNIHKVEIRNYPGWNVLYLHDIDLAVNTIAAPLYKSAGYIILALCLLTGIFVFILYKMANDDITRRKRAEEALRASEERYESLIENIPSVTWISNNEGVTTFISSNISRIYGYTPEEIYEAGDRFWFERVHEEDKAMVKDKYGSLFEKGSDYDIEYRIQRKDGEWIWLHDRAVTTFEKDGSRYAYGVFIDVTRRKRAEKELEQHEEYWRLLIENAMDIITVLDNSGVITYESPSITKTLGYKPEELVGRHVLELIHPDDKPRASEVLTNALTTPGHSESLVIKHRHRSGSWRNLAVIGKSFMDASGVLKVIINSRDVTERTNMENEREKLILTLREAIEEVRALSGLLPICSSCKKIRNDKGYWEQVEVYIQKHSEAEFSHGMCPDCAKKLYPKYYSKNT